MYQIVKNQLLSIFQKQFPINNNTFSLGLKNKKSFFHFLCALSLQNTLRDSISLAREEFEILKASHEMQDKAIYAIGPQKDSKRYYEEPN